MIESSRIFSLHGSEEYHLAPHRPTAVQKKLSTKTAATDG
jgi:hypothetical protein